MNKLAFFIFLIIAVSYSSFYGQEKKPIAQKKNYIGIEIIGSPLRLTYNRLLSKKSDITQSYFVGISPLALIGWPAMHIGYRAEKLLTSKFGLYSDIGLETLTIAFPILFFQNKKLFGSADIKELALDQTFGTIVQLKHFKITPLFIRTSLNAKYIFLEYGDEVTPPSSPLFFSFGTAIGYCF
jgi:hypothetical protein